MAASAVNFRRLSDPHDLHTKLFPAPAELSRCGLRHSDVREEEVDRAAPAEQDSVGPLLESRRAVAAGVVLEAMRERACCSVGADVIEGKAQASFSAPAESLL
jgi:hypothetical protein